MGRVGQAYDPLGIDNKVAAQLISIPAIEVWSLPPESGLKVVAHTIPAPRVYDRGFQPKGVIGLAGWIEPNRKGGLGLCQPSPGPILQAKRDGDYVRIQSLKFIIV